MTAGGRNAHVADADFTTLSDQCVFSPIPAGFLFTSEFAAAAHMRQPAVFHCVRTSVRQVSPARLSISPDKAQPDFLVVAPLGAPEIHHANIQHAN